VNGDAVALLDQHPPELWVVQSTFLSAVRWFLARPSFPLGDLSADDAISDLFLALERCDACHHKLLLPRRYHTGPLMNWIALDPADQRAWKVRIRTKRLLARSWDPQSEAERLGITSGTALEAEERLARLGVFAPNKLHYRSLDAFELAAQLGIMFDVDVTMLEAEKLLLRLDGRLVPFARHRDVIETELRRICRQRTLAKQQPAQAAIQLPSPLPVHIESVADQVRELWHQAARPAEQSEPDKPTDTAIATTLKTPRKRRVMKKPLSPNVIHPIIEEVIEAASPDVINRDDARKAVWAKRPEARQHDIDNCFQDKRYDGRVRRRKGED
jgi:hypothetical protein